MNTIASGKREYAYVHACYRAVERGRGVVAGAGAWEVCMELVLC